MANHSLENIDLQTIHQPLLNNPSELTTQLEELFRALAFENRSVLHPSRLNEVAAKESDGFFSFLSTKDVEAAKEHGQELLRKGVGESVILAVGNLLRNFCWERTPGMNLKHLQVNLNAVNLYITSCLQGYMEEHEVGVLKDQEQLRRALSAALERQGRELHIKNHAIDTSINGVMLADLNNQVNYVNPAFLFMWGYEDPSYVLGKNSFDFWESYESEETSVAFLEKRGGGWRGELTARRKDNSTFDVDISASLITDKNDQPVGIMFFFIDITERKRVEERIRKLNQELEQRVVERTAELRASLETLQKTQEQLIQSEKMSALGGLVAGVAHEINTPVGIGVTVASYFEQQSKELAELFASDNLKRSDLETYLKTAVDSANTILSNLHRAVDFLQTFKQVAVDQSSEEPRTFNLKKYIEDVLFSLRPKLKKTRHTLNVQCPDDIELYSYPGAFSQIITNLVMNSLIHGFENKEDGQIFFEISEEKRTIELRYSDNGKGIDETSLKKIFDPFFTTKRGQGGSGLGLHMVYNLVTQTLGGQIECFSTPGQSAAFDIRIPKTEESHDQSK